MKKRFFTILFIVLLHTCPSLADVFHGKVVGVSDGDTISVMRDGREEKVRLNGIDAPEKSQAFGTRAKQFTSSLVFGRMAGVYYQKRDRYGRILGNVVVDGKDLSRELLKAGLAWHYRQYSRDSKLQALEDQAHAARRGLWRDEDPTPPWQFRKERKSK